MFKFKPLPSSMLIQSSTTAPSETITGKYTWNSTSLNPIERLNTILKEPVKRSDLNKLVTAKSQDQKIMSKDYKPN